MRTITISLPPEAYASYQELSQATGETPEEAMSRLLEEFLRLTAGLYQVRQAIFGCPILTFHAVKP